MDLYHLDHFPASGTTLRALKQSIEDLGGTAGDESIVYLGKGQLRIGKETLAFHGQDELVLDAIVKLRAATKRQLEDESGVDDAVRVLRRLRKKHPALEQAIILPGKPASGGYRTTISCES